MFRAPVAKTGCMWGADGTHFCAPGGFSTVPPGGTIPTQGGGAAFAPSESISSYDVFGTAAPTFKQATCSFKAQGPVCPGQK